MSRNCDGIEFSYEDGEDVFAIPAAIIENAQILNLSRNIDISKFGEIRDVYDVDRLVLRIRSVSKKAIEEHFENRLISHFRIMGQPGSYRFLTIWTGNDDELLPVVTVKELEDSSNLIKLTIERPKLN